MSKAILLSGGIDSIALAYLHRPAIALTINYGQTPADTEIRVSRKIAEQLQIEHHVLSVDCSALGSGDLINREAIASSPSSEWWPFRNQLLVTLAAMKALSLGITELMTASVKSDGFHKDGTQEFYLLFDQLMSYQEGNLRVTAPAITLTSAELVQQSGVPKELLNWAHSCHKSNIPCGECRGCNKYREVMYQISNL